MTTFDYPWLQETVESIHRKQPTMNDFVQDVPDRQPSLVNRAGELLGKFDKWIDAKIPPVGAYYLPKWLGKVDTEDSVEYDSLGLPLKEVGGYDLNSGRGYDSLGLRRGLDDFGTKYWVEPRDCLGLVKPVPIYIIDYDKGEAIKLAPCGEVVTWNNIPIRCNPTLG